MADWRALGPGLKIVAADEPLGQAGHLAAGGGVVVNVAVTLAVADAFHERGDGVAQVQRHGLAGRSRRHRRRRLDRRFLTWLDLGALAR